MNGPLDGWKPKRYDPAPEPEPNGCADCAWRTWERIVWLTTLCVCVPLLAEILGNVTS